MSHTEQRMRSKAERIERLRERIEQLGWKDRTTRPVLDIMKGILDLLADEL